MSIPGPQDFVRETLPNGMVVLVRENHSSPSVVIGGYLQVGARDDTAELAGLSSFTASALTRGTSRRAFDRIYEDLESVGASLAIGGGTHSTSFRSKSLTEDVPLVLELLSDALRYPQFPDGQVEKLRGEIITDLKERAHDTRRMASLTFFELAYPEGHIYARSTAGYTHTIGAISRADLMDFHQKRYSPQGAVVAVAGAVHTHEILSLIESRFGDWQGKTCHRTPLPGAPRLTEIRRKSVTIPGKTQSDLVLGYPGPARTDPGFIDAAVCNTILGVFGLMGRLGDNLRDRQGLAYYTFSRVEGGQGPGPWLTVTGVNPASIDAAVASITEEIRRICEKLVDEQELADNKAYMIGSLPLGLESNEGVMRALVNMEKYDLGLDYLQRYHALIDEVSAERVRLAARAWLDAEAYALAVAGPTSN
jgi:zinc protease